MKQERRTVGIVFAMLGLILVALMVAVFIFDLEGCSDWDTVKVGKTTTTVCDDD